MRAIRVTVHGRVQGVGFRWSCLREAERLGIVGWVHNDPAGTVQVWIQGEEAAVGRMIAWCQEGPRHAWVERVDQEPVKPQELSGFDVR
ncbi:MULTISPECIES: acylphosphatase [unclassified Luteococcus]|uniref:acylphosphatase n=1 Tax=unclassified Luteococcus TaxID=2639923 RepID=UPI00313EBE8D